MRHRQLFLSFLMAAAAWRLRGALFSKVAVFHQDFDN
jgi:hypothetical protein